MSEGLAQEGEAAGGAEAGGARADQANTDGDGPHAPGSARDVGADAAVPDDRLYETGMEVRRAVLGDEHVDRALAATDELTRPFQELITRFAWGSVWSRDALDRRSRSMITLAVLSALGREHELEMHIRAAWRNGLTSEEIAEVLMHTGIYAGVPTANEGLATLKRLIAEERG